MKDLTHICIGAACGVVATGFDAAPDAVGWAALSIGSTLQDLGAVLVDVADKGEYIMASRSK